ncbi:MAG: type I-C CRISPR-associated protein Cas8c/Csd1, partial [Eubacteriales bacterium]|nr:type I-C CRISPR-associated protein Cas8c/Csd1 [Eubacteriales bacterium]
MILQALTQLYEDLVARGEIARPGWNEVKISYALCLDEHGGLIQVIPQLVEEQIGNRTVLRPRKMELPAVVTKASAVRSNFLWENSSYLLGVDDKGKPERSMECFRACVKLHHTLLDEVESPAAKAVLTYFDTWQPEQAQSHPALADCWDELMKGANLVFRVDGEFVQEDPLIRAAWDRHYSRSEGEKTQCLVTGKQDVPEPVHPFIKGVVGAQTSGAAIISFNEPAFCSYGKEQSLNAPVGKYAAFAYTAALNHLLADRDNVQRIGETTVVCWAEGAEPAYRKYTFAAIFGGPLPEQISTDTLRS